MPVVASALGALRERVERDGGGWLVDHTDPDAWFDTLRWVVGSPGEHARKRREIAALHLASREDMAEAYLELYSRLLGALRPRTGYSVSAEVDASRWRADGRREAPAPDDARRADGAPLRPRERRVARHDLHPLQPGEERRPRPVADALDGAGSVLESGYPVDRMRIERRQGVVSRPWLNAWREAPHVEWS